ncbi:MAG: hypothetical protein AMXMBFR13_10030 [Phycisphaerae bacterium]
MLLLVRPFHIRRPLCRLFSDTQTAGTEAGRYRTGELEGALDRRQAQRVRWLAGAALARLDQSEVLLVHVQVAVHVLIFASRRVRYGRTRDTAFKHCDVVEEAKFAPAGKSR